MDRILAAKLAPTYIDRMVEALDAYEEQKATHAAVRAAYRVPGRSQVVSDLRSQSDVRVTTAASLSSWYRDEAIAYATAASTLIAYAEADS